MTRNEDKMFFNNPHGKGVVPVSGEEDTFRQACNNLGFNIIEGTVKGGGVRHREVPIFEHVRSQQELTDLKQEMLRLRRARWASAREDALRQASRELKMSSDSTPSWPVRPHNLTNAHWPAHLFTRRPQELPVRPEAKEHQANVKK